MASFLHFALVIPINSRVNIHALLNISICINKLCLRFSQNGASKLDDVLKFISLEPMKIE